MLAARPSLPLLVALALTACHVPGPAALPAGDRSVRIAIKAVDPRALLSTVTRHALAELDHYVATLYVDDGGTFVSTGLSTTCTTQAGARIEFQHLASRRYQVQVIGYDAGDVAISDVAKSNVIDLTGNDVEATQELTVAVTLDKVFAGSVRLPAVDWAESVHATVKDGDGATVAEQTYPGGSTATVKNLRAGGSYDFVVTASDGNGYTESEQLRPNVTFDATSMALPASQTLAYRWRTFKTGQEPHGVAVDPASHDVWVANAGSDTLTRLALSAELVGSVVGQFPVGDRPWGVAVDAGSNVWVTNEGDGTVTKLASDGSLVGTFAVGAGPRGIAYDVANDAIWVANRTDGTLTCLSMAGATLATLTVGAAPEGVALDTAGDGWVVGGGATGYAVHFDADTRTVLGSVPVGAAPVGVALQLYVGETNNVYVTNSGDGTVSVINGPGQNLYDTLTVGSGPQGIASLGEGLAIAEQGEDGLREQSLVDAGPYPSHPISAPYGVAWDAEYGMAWTTSPTSHLVTAYALSGGS